MMWQLFYVQARIWKFAAPGKVMGMEVSVDNFYRGNC